MSIAGTLQHHAHNHFVFERTLPSIITETNALRASLGLAPLAEAPSAEEKQSQKDQEEEEFRKRQQEAEAAALREHLQKRKEQRQLDAKTSGPSLGISPIH